MKTTKACVMLTCLFLAISLPLNGTSQKSPAPANETVRRWVLSELQQAQRSLVDFFSRQTSGQWQSSYRKARQHYKHVEFFVEFCSPQEAKYFINGPLVPKHEPDWGNEMQPPHGFQRIEELLFSSSTQPDTAELYPECRLLISRLSDLENYYASVELTDGILLEMSQLELYRIAALTLNGYDATITQSNVQEATWCLEGLEKVIHAYSGYGDQNGSVKKVSTSVLRQLATAKAYLRKDTRYATFNRLPFIVTHINPLNRLLVQFHKACQLPWSDRKQALRLQQDFLFGKESLNARYFSMYYDDTLHLDRQAALGKLLFFDPALSGNNQVACATCHDPAKAFTDGLPAKITGNKAHTIARNTPTLLNVIFQKAFFYDGRAYQLEQQVFDVVHNKNEMQSSLTDIAAKLRKSVRYRQWFTDAFEGSSDSIITPYAIQKALTEYEKTLLSFDSPFDRYLRGNSASLNAREINGYNLFAGKALCGSCHFLPLFNGTVPPFFNDSEFEVVGTPADATNRSLDKDEGRYSVTRINEHQYAFKTPTIRNIELTAPYMHNGAYTTLEQVVEFYHRGGGRGLGFSLPNQTLPFDSLPLTETEKQDIVLFMKTLTDTTGTTSRPASIP